MVWLEKYLTVHHAWKKDCKLQGGHRQHDIGVEVCRICHTLLQSLNEGSGVYSEGSAP